MNGLPLLRKSAERSQQLLRKALAHELSDAEALDLAAIVAAAHSQLRSHGFSELRSLLAFQAQRFQVVEQLAGEPRRVVTPTDSAMKQARIASQAKASIWDEEMLPSSEVARWLGGKPTNRQKANSLRQRSQLLGLPHEPSQKYLYPAFQIDPTRQRVYPEVQEINSLLDSVEDPWGVASWWVSENARLGSRPMDLVGGPEASAAVEAAKAVLDPVG